MSPPRCPFYLATGAFHTDRRRACVVSHRASGTAAEPAAQSLELCFQRQKVQMHVAFDTSWGKERHRELDSLFDVHICSSELCYSKVIPFHKHQGARQGVPVLSISPPPVLRGELALRAALV